MVQMILKMLCDNLSMYGENIKEDLVSGQRKRKTLHLMSPEHWKGEMIGCLRFLTRPI